MPQNTKNVYANYGSGTGKGTYESLYACLMEGEHDDYLVWPFRGMSPLINNFVTWLANHVMVNSYSERGGSTHITTTLTLCFFLLLLVVYCSGVFHGFAIQSL